MLVIVSLLLAASISRGEGKPITRIGLGRTGAAVMGETRGY
jgi:hypothetical protein